MQTLKCSSRNLHNKVCWFLLCQIQWNSALLYSSVQWVSFNIIVKKKQLYCSSKVCLLLNSQACSRVFFCPGGSPAPLPAPRRFGRSSWTSPSEAPVRGRVASGNFAMPDLKFYLQFRGPHAYFQIWILCWPTPGLAALNSCRPLKYQWRVQSCSSDISDPYDYQTYNFIRGPLYF